MAQVNREGLILGIVVVKDNLAAVGIVTYQSVAKTSVSVDCVLGGVAALGVRYAVQIVDLQVLPSLVVNVNGVRYAVQIVDLQGIPIIVVVNVGNRSLLLIGTVLDGFGNVGCVVCHVLVAYHSLVRRVALYAW